MAEYYIHSIVKDFVKYWSPNSCPEDYLTKLLHYQKKFIDQAGPIAGHIDVREIADKSPDPDLFYQKYDDLNSGNTDLLSKYIRLLRLIQSHPAIAEEFKRRYNESKKNTAKVNSSSVENVDPNEDVKKFCDELQVIVKQVEERKMRQVYLPDKKQMTRKTSFHELTLWEDCRPFMSGDFSREFVMHNLLPIGAVPPTSQEKYLVSDVLQCLLGFNGKYIHGIRDQCKRTFMMETSIYSPFKEIISKILVLTEYYSNIMHFIEEKNLYSCGRVNQALCSILEDLMQDYRIGIIRLELRHKTETLTLQHLVFSIQTYLETMGCLSSIVSSINKAGARGGRTLSLLHDTGKHSIEHKAVDILVDLIREASVPYFQSLEQWINTGFIHDPCNEFMIDDNSEMEDISSLMKGESPHDYWKRRYQINKDNVPTFLQQYQEKILRTGKYLNTIKQCKNVSLQEMNKILSKKPVTKPMSYTSLNNHEFVATIETAYKFACDTLLGLIMNEYHIMDRLISIKRYFLTHQGDFLNILMDLCEEDFITSFDQISPIRLNSLVELAIRTSSASRNDPYKNDIYLLTGQKELVLQIYKINAINTAYEKEIKNKNSYGDSLTGLDVVTLHLKTSWPVSLILHEKVIGSYQMLFRLLLQCKFLERSLCKVWIYDQCFKNLRKESRKLYMKAFLLRRKMLIFIKSINYYMTNEVIELHWQTFLNAIEKSQNVDDVMNHHWTYVRSCTADCMLTSPQLIRQIMWIIKCCSNFCSFIQYMRMYFMDAEYTSMLGSTTSEYVHHGIVLPRGEDLKRSSSFESKIDDYDNEFNNNLSLVLQLIVSMHVMDGDNQLLHLLTRQNFNGYYNPHTSHKGNNLSGNEK